MRPLEKVWLEPGARWHILPIMMHRLVACKKIRISACLVPRPRTGREGPLPAAPPVFRMYLLLVSWLCRLGRRRERGEGGRRGEVRVERSYTSGSRAFPNSGIIVDQSSRVFLDVLRRCVSRGVGDGGWAVGCRGERTEGGGKGEGGWRGRGGCVDKGWAAPRPGGTVRHTTIVYGLPLRHYNR